MGYLISGGDRMCLYDSTGQYVCLNIVGTFYEYPYQKSLTPVLWMPFLANETVTVAFVIHKASKTYRIPDRSMKSNLLDTLIQHSIFYYLTILIIYVLGLAPLLGLNSTIVQPFESLAFDHLLFSIVVSGILAPNLFLSLRKAYYSNHEVSIPSRPSAIVFNTGPISHLLSMH